MPADSIPDLTAAEFRTILARAVADLPAATRAVYERFAVPALRLVHTWPHAGQLVSGPVWVIARKDMTVLGYDEIEEEYGMGQVAPGPHREGSTVAEWGTWGEQLHWSLLRFPDPRAFAVEPADQHEPFPPRPS